MDLSQLTEQYACCSPQQLELQLGVLERSIACAHKEIKDSQEHSKWVKDRVMPSLNQQIKQRKKELNNCKNIIKDRKAKTIELKQKLKALKSVQKANKTPKARKPKSAIESYLNYHYTPAHEFASQKCSNIADKVVGKKVFSTAMAAWKTLSPEEQAKYAQEAERKKKEVEAQRMREFERKCAEINLERRRQGLPILGLEA